MSQKLLHLPVADLVPGNDFRLDEDLEALRQLADSIVEHGVLQPLTVRMVGFQPGHAGGGEPPASGDDLPGVVDRLLKLDREQFPDQKEGAHV